MGLWWLFNRQAGSRYWEHVQPQPDTAFANETGQRTFVSYELMIRQPWRRTGLSSPNKMI